MDSDDIEVAGSPSSTMDRSIERGDTEEEPGRAGMAKDSKRSRERSDISKTPFMLQKAGLGREI
jgi:hypothetical protein